MSSAALTFQTSRRLDFSWISLSSSWKFWCICSGIRQVVWGRWDTGSVIWSAKVLGQMIASKEGLFYCIFVRYKCFDSCCG